jgi:hypothetical protein
VARASSAGRQLPPPGSPGYGLPESAAHGPPRPFPFSEAVARPERTAAQGAHGASQRHPFPHSSPGVATRPPLLDHPQLGFPPRAHAPPGSLGLGPPDGGGDGPPLLAAPAWLPARGPHAAGPPGPPHHHLQPPERRREPTRASAGAAPAAYPRPSAGRRPQREDRPPLLPEVRGHEGQPDAIAPPREEAQARSPGPGALPTPARAVASASAGEEGFDPLERSPAPVGWAGLIAKDAPFSADASRATVWAQEFGGRLFALDKMHRHLRARLHTALAIPLQQFLLLQRRKAASLLEFQQALKECWERWGPKEIRDFARILADMVPELVWLAEMTLSSEMGLLLCADFFNADAGDLQIHFAARTAKRPAHGWRWPPLTPVLVEPYKMLQKLVSRLCRAAHHWTSSSTYTDQPWNLDHLAALVRTTIEQILEDCVVLPIPSEKEMIAAALRRAKEQHGAHPELMHLMQHRSFWLSQLEALHKAREGDNLVLLEQTERRQRESEARSEAKRELQLQERGWLQRASGDVLAQLAQIGQAAEPLRTLLITSQQAADQQGNLARQVAALNTTLTSLGTHLFSNINAIRPILGSIAAATASTAASASASASVAALAPAVATPAPAESGRASAVWPAPVWGATPVSTATVSSGPAYTAGGPELVAAAPPVGATVPTEFAHTPPPAAQPPPGAAPRAAPAGPHIMASVHAGAAPSTRHAPPGPGAAAGGSALYPAGAAAPGTATFSSAPPVPRAAGGPIPPSVPQRPAGAAAFEAAPAPSPGSASGAAGTSSLARSIGVSAAYLHSAVQYQQIHEPSGTPASAPPTSAAGAPANHAFAQAAHASASVGPGHAPFTATERAYGAHTLAEYARGAHTAAASASAPPPAPPGGHALAQARSAPARPAGPPALLTALHGGQERGPERRRPANAKEATEEAVQAYISRLQKAHKPPALS